MENIIQAYLILLLCYCVSSQQMTFPSQKCKSKIQKKKKIFKIQEQILIPS